MNRIYFIKDFSSLLLRLKFQAWSIPIVCLSLFLLSNTNTYGQATDLIISEYIEGSSNNKFIEIYNGTGSEVSLSNYSVKLYSNGGTTASQTKTFTTETLANNATLVIKNSGASIVYNNAISSTVCYFNGNDAIALLKDNVIIDALGNIGSDDYFGKDKTLIRKSNIKSPNNTYTTDEWEVQVKDYADNLGSHSMDGQVSLPKINLSASTNTATEEDQTTITLTATLNETLDTDQTVSLEISGSNITDSDYTLSSNTITIVKGETTGTTTLTISDDSDQETTETLTVKLTNLSSEIELGNTSSQNISITDNDTPNGSNGAATDLIISEYIEGGGYNKFIEIYNGTGNEISLANYSLERYNDGSTPANGSITFTTEKIADGATLVIKNSQASIVYDNALVNNSLCGFNGDDVVALLKDGTIIDVVGTLGVDQNFGKDKTLVRKSSINSPNITYTLDEWEVFSKDNSDNLGLHTIDPVGPSLPKVNLSVSSNTATEADQTQITLTATVSETLTENQTVSVNIAGTNITATDYNLASTEITITAGQTTGTTSLTILDDSDIEPTETLTATLASPSSDIELGSSISENIAITDNDIDNRPKVNLSVSTNTASEADQTEITLTATVSETLVENQTVTLDISGTGITATDYSLSATEISIVAGQTTGTTTLNILDDSDKEGTETLTVSFTSTSSGIGLGSSFTENITITDNDQNGTGTILDNYVYVDPTVDGDGNVIVALTPKEYVKTVSPSQHLNSTGYEQTYYSTAIGLTGSTLRSEIKTIISTGAKALNYSVVWDMCKAGDQSPSDPNRIWQIYVETNKDKSKQDNGSSGDYWNREHVWAKAHGGFGTSAGAGTDGHHLRAADKNENNSRGNRDFANTSPGYTPPKSARGDVARMIFYMATRYGMTVDNQVKSQESAPRHGKLSDLLEWHEEDPVDPYEVRRNNIIFGFQNNRNPFVDHPELVQYIFGEAKAAAWDGGNNGVAAKITINGSIADFGVVKFGTESTTQSVSVSATELTENITVTAPQHFKVSTDNTTFFSNLTIAQTNGTVDATTLYVKFVPESAFGTETSGTITLVSGENNRTISVKGTESDPALIPVAILNEDFESTTHENWSYISEVGGKDWEIKTYNLNKYAQMSAYSSGDNSDQSVISWLISPAINLTAFDNEILTFKTNNGFYKGTTLKVFISTDFDGTNTSAANWTELAAVIDEVDHEGYGSSFTASGDVDLSAYDGQIYIAFKYEGNRNGLTTTYQVDDISVKGIAAPQTGTISTNAPAEGFTFDYSEAGTSSTAQSYQLQFSGITSDLSVNSSKHFEVSLDQAQWSQTISIAKDAVSMQTIFVRYSPTATFVNGYAGKVTHIARAAAEKVIDLKANKHPDVQDASDLSMDKTFDVVTWNLEWFGVPSKSKSASSFDEQLNGAATTITSLDADVYALQEVIVDDLNGDFLTPLVNKLNETNPNKYAAVVGPRYSHDDDAPTTEFPAQRICYIYNTETVNKINSFSMFTDLYPNTSTTSIPGYTGTEPGKFWASGRLPFIFEANVSVDGSNENIKLINIHAKCCYDGVNRRRADASFLLNSLKDNYDTDNLIVLGDYNDYKEGSIANGTSPYVGFWADNNLHFKHVAGAQIDHIAVSNELYDETDILLNNSSVGSTNISDHDPVMLRIKLHVKQNQTITFNSISDKTYGESFDLSATASSGLPVTFEIVNGNATIDGTSLTITGTGTVEVKAVQVGNNNYSPASATQTFNVAKADQTITFDAIADKTFGDAAFELTAQASTGLAVTFEVVSGNATINGTTLTITGTGAFEVKAVQAGNENHNAASSTQTFNVAKADQTITFDAIADKTFGDAAFELTAQASTGLAVTFEVVSGNATIDGTKLTITGTGTVEVKAVQAGNENYNAASSTQTFNVAKADQTITFDAIADKTFGDAAFDLTAQASTGLAVTFEVVSGNATINGTTLTITGTGAFEVKAVQAGNENYNAASSTQTFNVAKADQTITFDAIADKTFGDAAFELTAQASTGLAVTFEVVSGNATINGTTLTITGTGAVEVKAVQAGNENYKSASVTQTFNVKQAATKQDQIITFVAIADKTFGDFAFELAAQASSALPVTFEVVSGNATVDGTTLTITGAGAVEVKAIQTGNDNYNAAFATQTFNVVKADQAITFNAITDKTFGNPAFELIAQASTGLTVAFEIVNGNATINGTTLTITGAGAIEVKAVQAGNENYNSASAAQTFKVTKADQTVTFDAVTDKIFGDAAFELTAQASSALTVTFEVISGDATINGTTLTITGAGAIEVKAIQTGNDNYNAAFATQTFDVSKVNQVITFEAIDDIKLGSDPIELKAKASSLLDITFEIIEGNGTINGDVFTATSPGKVTIRAIQNGNGNYLSASAEQSFIVNQTTSINILKSIEVKVGPNPAFDYVEITIPDQQKANIKLVDSEYKVLLRNISKKQISLTELKAGTYFLIIDYDNQRITKKIIKL